MEVAMDRLPGAGLLGTAGLLPFKAQRILIRLAELTQFAYSQRMAVEPTPFVIL